MLKTYDVIIVDSGIELEHKYFQNLSYHPDSVFFEMNEKKEIVEKNLVTDNIGHGTAICSIICRKEMPLHVLVVKLFEDETVEEEKFLIALRYIKEHYKAKIIHFSIGIVCSEWKKELHNLTYCATSNRLCENL